MRQVITKPKQCDGFADRIRFKKELFSHLCIMSHKLTTTCIQGMSSEEDDVVTPTSSPISIHQSLNRHKYIQLVNTCETCRMSNRRVPITCETDLYHKKISTCKHYKLGQPTLLQTRSLSTLTFPEHNGHQREQHFHQPPPPPKLTNTLTSNRKEVIRPIACKPVVSGNRFYQGPLNYQMGRHGSEINLGKTNNGLDTQRFGGSLCNVLPSTSLRLANDVSISVPHINSGLLGSGAAGDHSTYANLSQRQNNPTEINHIRRTPQHLHLGKHREVTIDQLRNMVSQQPKVSARNGNNLESASVDELRHQLADAHTEIDEAKWMLCHKTGEISFLKTRLKDSQRDEMTRGNEASHFRSVIRDLSSVIDKLRSQLSQALSSVQSMQNENAQLKQKLSQNDVGRNECEVNVVLRKRLRELELKYSMEYAQWDRQRKRWMEEQKRVLRYQKALQHNYLLTCQKAQSLAAQVESFSSVSV